MSFFSSRKVPVINSYAAASQYYRNRKFPRSKYWPDAFQRPLRRTGEPNFAMTQHPNAVDPDRKGGMGVEGELQTAYSLDLYSTPVITFFPPHPDGSYRVIINMSRVFWSRAMTYQWLQRHLGNRFRDASGEVRYVPLGPPVSHISASLWFEGRDTLNPDKSWHVPMYKRVATKEDRQISTALRKAIRPYLDLAAMYAEDVVRGVEEGGSTNTQNSVDTDRIVKEAKRRNFDEFLKDPSHPPTAMQLDLLRQGYVGVALESFLESRRQYENAQWRVKTSPYPHSAFQPNSTPPPPPLMEYFHSNQNKIEASLIRYLQSAFRQQTGEIQIPQFPLLSTIKGRNYFFKRT